MIREEEWFASRLFENERLAPREKPEPKIYMEDHKDVAYEVCNNTIYDVIDGESLERGYDLYVVRINGVWYPICESTYQKYEDLFEATNCEHRIISDFDGTDETLDNELDTLYHADWMVKQIEAAETNA